jgi:hypothetical protein
VIFFAKLPTGTASNNGTHLGAMRRGVKPQPIAAQSLTRAANSGKSYLAPYFVEDG